MRLTPAAIPYTSGVRHPSDPDDPQACYDAALRALELRWHGEREIAAKLRSKGFGSGAIATALQRLREEGWIDDARFADAYARGGARKKHGPERIRRELLAAGIDDGIASAAARGAFEEGDEEAALAVLCRKKAAALVSRHGAGYVATDEGRNKLIGFLLKQGYEYAAVQAAVRGLIHP